MIRIRGSSDLTGFEDGKVRRRGSRNISEVEMTSPYDKDDFFKDWRNR